MPRTIVNFSDELPAPNGPYSVAVIGPPGSRVLFISGQVAVGRDGALVGVGDIERQARQAFANLFLILEEAGGSLADLVKVTIYLKDIADLPVVGRVRREVYRDEPYPATSTIQARLAHEDMLIEVEGIAFLP